MIWLKLWPYALGAILFGSLGAFTAHTLDGRRYDALALDFANYRIASSEAAIKAQEAARAVLEAQIKQAHETTLNNQAVIHDLQTQTAAIAADRDHARELARRLLAATSRPAAGSGPVPEASDKPGTAGASEAGSDGTLAGLLGNVAADFEWNADSHDALIQQLKPQL